ncbi:MAG: helix-hairpin-helix domain-containing protein [Bacteroidetes bacterium]|nr:helix-hairpin-helix domain-containing protein [Bacteroidota bacterium]
MAGLARTVALLLAYATQPDSLPEPEEWLEPELLETLWEEQLELLSRPIELNRAGWRELLRLPGMRPEWAHAIVQARSRWGGFRSLADLFSVPGLDPHWIRRWWPFLRLRATQPGLRARAYGWLQGRPGSIRADGRLSLQGARLQLVARGNAGPSGSIFRLGGVLQAQGIRLTAGSLMPEAGSGLLLGSPWRSRRPREDPVYTGNTLRSRSSVSRSASWGVHVSARAWRAHWDLLLLRHPVWGPRPRSAWQPIWGVSWDDNQTRLGLLIAGPVGGPARASLHGGLEERAFRLWGEGVCAPRRGVLGWLLGAELWPRARSQLALLGYSYLAALASPWTEAFGYRSGHSPEAGVWIRLQGRLSAAITGWASLHQARLPPEPESPWTRGILELELGLRLRTADPDGELWLRAYSERGPERVVRVADALGRLERIGLSAQRLGFEAGGLWTLPAGLTARLRLGAKRSTLDGEGLFWQVLLRHRFSRYLSGSIRYGGAHSPGYAVRFFAPQPGPPGAGSWAYGEMDQMGLELSARLDANLSLELFWGTERRGRGAFWPSAAGPRSTPWWFSLALSSRWGS